MKEEARLGRYENRDMIVRGADSSREGGSADID
jgi:hypothetical protein